MDIQVNKELCIGCGLCSRDCLARCLQVQDGVAVYNPTGCIDCGHCYAVCPTGAISMPEYDTASLPAPGSMTNIDPQTLLLGMKSRRTIRHFKNKPVEQEKIDMILEAGRYAPTGTNAQKNNFIILGSRQDEIEAACVNFFRSGEASKYVGYVDNLKVDDHFMFKGAPLVIVVSAKYNIDAALSSAYMELMAESLGLGVLYSGFFSVCAQYDPEVARLLEMKPRYKAFTCLVMGYPDVNYRRLVPRKDPQVKIL